MIPQEDIDDDPVVRLVQLVGECIGDLSRDKSQGIELAIRREFGNELLYVKGARVLERKQRDDAIRTEIHKGTKTGVICKLFAVSRWHVARCKQLLDEE